MSDLPHHPPMIFSLWYVPDREPKNWRQVGQPTYATYWHAKAEAMKLIKSSQNPKCGIAIGMTFISEKQVFCAGWVKSPAPPFGKKKQRA